nr:MAG TPA: hypothetical protein [Caudoviricetes sp.]
MCLKPSIYASSIYLFLNCPQAPSISLPISLLIVTFSSDA